MLDLALKAILVFALLSLLQATSRAEPDPHDLLITYSSEPMKMWPIFTRVNKPENDDGHIAGSRWRPICRGLRCRARTWRSLRSGFWEPNRAAQSSAAYEGLQKVVF